MNTLTILLILLSISCINILIFIFLYLKELKLNKQNEAIISDLKEKLLNIQSLASDSYVISKDIKDILRK